MAIFVYIVLFAFSASLQVHGVTSWSFAPWSEPVVIVEDYDINLSKFTIMCQAVVPLVKCQFKVEPTDYDFAYPIIDLSHGLSSGVMTKDNFTCMSHMLDIRYNGTGLEHGQCGATFRAYGLDEYESYYNFGCRGADKAGEWHEMEFPGVFHLPSDFPASINPREAVVKPGDNVTFLLKTNSKIKICAVNMTGLYNSRPQDFSSIGKMLSEGECGVTVKNVTKAVNGPLALTGWSSGNGILIRRSSTLIVAVKPLFTSFYVDMWTYSVGDTLTAICYCQHARPVANLTWTLDGKVIRQDAIDDDFKEDVWKWSWEMKDIYQSMSIILKKEDFGKKIECIVQHLASPKNETYSDVIHSVWSRGISWEVIALFIFIIMIVLSPLLSFKNYYYKCYTYFKSFF